MAQQIIHVMARKQKKRKEERVGVLLSPSGHVSNNQKTSQKVPYLKIPATSKFHQARTIHLTHKPLGDISDPHCNRREYRENVRNKIQENFSITLPPIYKDENRANIFSILTLLCHSSYLKLGP